MKTLQDKIAVVTGGSRGIGRAIALRLAEDGALVCVNYRSNAGAAAEAVHEIEAHGGQAFAIQGDVGSVEQLGRFFEALDAELTARRGAARFDILVNNAGVADGGAWDATTEADFDRLFATNVKGPFFVTQHAAPRLRDGGRIINVSSNLSRHPMPGYLAYCMTKAAIDNFTVGLAGDLGRRGITVNTLAPGLTATDLTTAIREHPGIEQRFASMTALGRIGNVEDGEGDALTMERTVIVTGGNSGLGYECVRSILREGDGWHVIIAGRSRERSEAAAVRLAAETSNPNVRAMALDLASQTSIRQFVEVVKSLDIPPVAALVCNAGVQVVRATETTKDGIEATFGVNHLGHFLLTNLLLDHLRSPARIVFVSSGTHDPAKKTGMPHPSYREPHTLAFPENNPGENPRLVGMRRYTTSKLCNVLCAYELDRRLRADPAGVAIKPIDVFAFDPGLMPGTGLARDYGPALRFLWHRFGPALRPLLRLLIGNVHTTFESGRSLARLVLDPAQEGTGGRYFEGDREIRSSLESYDEAKAGELWEQSAELVSLQPTSRLEKSSNISL